MYTINTDENALWKQRFRQARILKTTVAAANPARGLVSSNKSGRYQLYAWDVLSGRLHPLTDKEGGVFVGEIDPQGKYVYYLDDQKGDEMGHVVRVPFTGGEPEDLTPDLPRYTYHGLAIDYANEHMVLCISIKEDFQLYGLDLEADGEIVSGPHLLTQTQDFAVLPFMNHDGELVVWHHSQEQKMWSRLSAINRQTGAVMAELSDGPEYKLRLVRFSPLPGDSRLLGRYNQTGFERPFIWDPDTNARLDLPFLDFEGDILPIDWSADGGTLLLSHINQARQQLYLYELETESLTRLEHPSGTFGPGVDYAQPYFGPAGNIYAGWQDAGHPLGLIELDGETGQKQRVLLTAGESLPGRAWESITFSSTDGQAIQAWMVLPGPREEGPYPTILHMTGGPGDVMMASYSATAQMWVDHGFAFVSVNYRGCATFGQEFQDKILGNMGHWEVEDMAAATRWLIQQEIAQMDKVLLLGWSYGGYLALLGLGIYPELWAGGLTCVVIADWLELYHDVDEGMKPVVVHFLGGTPEEVPEQYTRSSPLTYVEKVQAPVLIIQAHNDSRTPPRPVRMYEEKMKAYSKDIEVDWFDEGHLGGGVELDIKQAQRMLTFATRKA